MKILLTTNNSYTHTQLKFQKDLMTFDLDIEL